jgi:hypothetical protein
LSLGNALAEEAKAKALAKGGSLLLAGQARVACSWGKGAVGDPRLLICGGGGRGGRPIITSSDVETII